MNYAVTSQGVIHDELGNPLLLAIIPAVAAIGTAAVGYFSSKNQADSAASNAQAAAAIAAAQAATAKVQADAKTAQNKTLMVGGAAVAGVLALVLALN